MLKFRSVRSIVIAPAKTGIATTKRKAVIAMDHTNKVIRLSSIISGRMFTTVARKLIAPRIEEIPARCREKIPQSTDPPLWVILPESGGYTVQPVPTPLSTKADLNKRKRAGGRSQKLILFIRGKAMSGEVNIRGTIQFPNPPTVIGMTKKKIITKA